MTTLPDLLKYASALFRRKLLSPKSQAFLMSVAEGMNDQPLGKKRVWAMQAIRKPYGVLVYKEGDGPGGVNTLMAYNPSNDEIYLGFTNIFGYFNEVDFLMDEVIGGLSTTTQGARHRRAVMVCSYHAQREVLNVALCAS